MIGKATPQAETGPSKRLSERCWCMMSGKLGVSRRYMPSRNTRLA